MFIMVNALCGMTLMNGGIVEKIYPRPIMGIKKP
jgi:hypothetical protein